MQSGFIVSLTEKQEDLSFTHYSSFSITAATLYSNSNFA